MRDLIRFCRDLRGLFAIHLALFATTMVFAAGETDDVRFQAAYFVFVLPGWLLSPRWTGSRCGLATQYFHALVTSFLIHAWLAAVGVLLELGFHQYFIGFGLVLTSAIVDRFRCLQRAGTKSLQRSERSLRVSPGDLCLWVAVVLLIVIVYRLPRSNDIVQFIIQQQDAIVTRTLSPSAIGVSGMGMDGPMSRWNANYWHLWPALMAVASGLPIRDVLYRFAPIPLALAAMVSLVQTLRSLCNSKTPLWAVLLAVFGPVVLWYRAYNAFTYSFRLTNTFCLDKDYCLFFLIPAILYLVTGWLRGGKHYLPILLLSIPAIVRFHPMTAVYLVLLTPFVLFGYQKSIVNLRSVSVVVSVVLIFVAVVAIGDAQSFHREIQAVIRIDFDDSQTGRPLHYWVGQYASIRQFDLPLDTSKWVGDRFQLKFAILYDSGLFLLAHLGWIVWGFSRLKEKRSNELSRWAAVGIALATLWFVILISPFVLGRYPHIIAGYERLHWFAFVPALVACSVGFSTVTRWIGSNRLGPYVQIFTIFFVAALLVYSAGCMKMFRSTGLANVRGLNSRLDYELADYIERSDRYDQHLHDDLLSRKPAFLDDDDRVLYLGGSGIERYWLMKQSVFWRELYAEAFALHKFGDRFLADRQQVYALVDRVQISTSIRKWLYEKRITLMVDLREGGDAFLEQLKENQGLNMTRIESGVWRIER